MNDKTTPEKTGVTEKKKKIFLPDAVFTPREKAAAAARKTAGGEKFPEDAVAENDAGFFSDAVKKISAVLGRYPESERMSAAADLEIQKEIPEYASFVSKYLFVSAFRLADGVNGERGAKLLRHALVSSAESLAEYSGKEKNIVKDFLRSYREYGGGKKLCYFENREKEDGISER